jgi:hypothetical protein
MTPDPEPNVDSRINSSELSPAEETDLHRLPIPDEYTDFVEAYRYMAYMVEFGVVTVIENEGDLSSSEKAGRVVIATDDDKMFVDSVEMDLGDTIDDISELADGSGVIDFDSLTLDKGKLSPDTLIVPEL